MPLPFRGLAKPILANFLLLLIGTSLLTGCGDGISIGLALLSFVAALVLWVVLALKGDHRKNGAFIAIVFNTVLVSPVIVGIMVEIASDKSHCRVPDSYRQMTAPQIKTGATSQESGVSQ